MATFPFTVELAAGPDGPFEELEALVGTLATYTVVPAPTLRRLGVEPIDRLPLILPDGSRREQPLGEARVRIGGRERTTVVVFGDEGGSPLLGAVTLGAFALSIDAASRRLVRVDAHLPGIRVPVGAEREAV